MVNISTEYRFNGKKSSNAILFLYEDRHYRSYRMA